MDDWVTDEPVVRCANLSVRYGETQALADVSLGLEAGRIHVLVGQNGAGKTTLARLLAGLVQPDNGHFWIREQEMGQANVHQVRTAGLDIVHQRFTLPPTFTVAEALELAAGQKQAGRLYSAKALSAAWQANLEEADLSIPATAQIQDLPVEVTQSLEILRALAGNAKILILDEPTALLSPDATEQLFQRLRRLRDQGVTLLVILHKLREVFAIAETISVLHAGRLVLPPTPIAEVNEGMLSDLVISGSKTQLQDSPLATGTENPLITTDESKSTVSRLRLESIRTAGSEVEPPLKNVSLQIMGNEIVGIAGVEGNGQRGIVDIITGLEGLQQGQVHLLGEEVTQFSTGERRQLGLRVVPFDRMVEGASLLQPLWENVTVWQAETFRQGWIPWLPLLSVGKMRQAAKKSLDRFGVKYENLEQEAGSLSGGNLQRVILARELAQGAQMVIAAQPTRGLDFQATEFVWHVLAELRSSGAGVMLVSSDLDELFQISDRILVVRAGEIVGEFRPPYEYGAVGDAMIGAVR